MSDECREAAVTARGFLIFAVTTIINMPDNVIPKSRRRYKDADIRSMRINPYVDGSPFEKYPQLQELKDAASEMKLPSIDWDAYVIYLSLAYDPNSPIQKDYSGNMPAILEESAKLVGLNVEHVEPYRDITHLFLQAILKSMLWAEICTLEAQFWQYTKRLNEPVKGSTEDDILKAVERQGKMASQMSQFRKQVSQLREEFYGGDKDLSDAFETEDYTPEAQNRRQRAAAGKH